ncbi:MAG: hypothetical protein OXR73_34825 [Myxococcales bacterium]|nr:hypothetical protein [Myxococcales bacterium]
MPGPQAAARAFAGAIERLDPKGVYASMHSRARADTSFPDFARAFADNQAELLELASLLRTRDIEVRACAEVELSDGELVTLVLEQGGWRLSGAFLDGRALATPRDTVVALHRALLRRDLSALLRILTSERRAGWLAALGRSLDASADPLDLRIEVQGERATATAPDGTRIHLRRESGTWHLADIE